MHVWKYERLTASTDKCFLLPLTKTGTNCCAFAVPALVGACAHVAVGSAIIQTSCKVGTAVVDLQMSKLVVTHFSAELLCDAALLCSDRQQHGVPCHICDQLLVCCAS